MEIKNTYYLVLLVAIIIHISYSTTAQNISYQQQLSSARTEDNIAFNQIDRLKTVLVDLNKTAYYDTTGFAQYFIAYRYNFLTMPPIPDSSIVYSKAALRNFEKANYNDYRKQYVLAYLLEDLNKKGRHIECINYFQKYTKSYILDNYNMESNIIIELSKAYKNLGEYEIALNTLNKFIIDLEGKKIGSQPLSNIYLEKSFIEYHLKDYKNAEKSVEQSIYYEKQNDDKIDINRISNILSQKAIILSALDRYKEAYNLYRSYLNKKISDENRFALLNNAYDNFNKAGQYEVASTYAKEAYEINQELENNLTYSFASIYNISESHRTLNKLDSAVHYAHEGIQYLLTEKQKGVNVNLQLIKINYNQLLNYKAIYDQNDEAHYLDSALIQMELIDSLLPEYINHIIFEGSLIKNKQEIATWYDTGVELSVALNSADLFVKYSDKTKALSFLKNLDFGEQELSIRDSLIREESQIELELLLDRLGLLQDSLNQNLYENREEQRKMMQEINSNSEQKISISAANINEQENHNVSVLYFHLTDSIVYACHLLPDQHQLIKIGNRAEIVDLVDKLYSAIKSRTIHKDEAKLLYNRLINPLKDLNHRLVIIPDQELSLIPFESLISHDNSLALEKHEISYTLSFDQFIKQSKNNINKVNQFEIISPNYTEGYTENFFATKGLNSISNPFAYLGHTKEEVSFLRDQFSTTIQEGTDISKDNFFNTLSKVDILHFTGHAVSLLGNDNISFLALGESADDISQDIFINEIANQKTNAALITLNACNTGVGEILKGEGVYNLARSFFKAGASSVVSSLWSIEDYSSSEITKSFYTYLKKGESKSKALRLAKLDYLDNAQTDELRHPYYWSGLIITGCTTPLFKDNFTYLYLFGALLFLLILMFFKRYRSTIDQ